MEEVNNGNAEQCNGGSGTEQFAHDVAETFDTDAIIERKENGLVSSIFLGLPDSGISSLIDRLVRPRDLPDQLANGKGMNKQPKKDVDAKRTPSLHAVRVCDCDTWEEIPFDASLLEKKQFTTLLNLCGGATFKKDSDDKASGSEENLPICDSIILNYGSYEEFKNIGSRSFYLSDAGSLVAFHEIPTLLVSGPGIIFLVFRADIDFTKKFEYEYKISEDESRTFKISNEEAILRCLRSINAISGPQKPQVFLAATHFDDTLISIDEFNEKLLHLVKNNRFSDLVLFADRKKRRILFAVNNLSSNDADFKVIRSRVHNQIYAYAFMAQYPVKYFLFCCELLQDKRTILALEDFRDLASKYRIRGNDVFDLMNFLHFRIGNIQYFCEEKIVVKLSVLCENITDLIIRTHACELVSMGEADDFVFNGIITASTFKKVVLSESTINAKSFLNLFVQHHGGSRFTVPGIKEEKYFIRCALPELSEHSKEPLNANSLFITFKSQGLFSVLVAFLMEFNENGITFVPKNEQQYRNQVVFDVQPSSAKGSVSLKDHSSFLELCYISENDLEAFADTCNSIRLMVEKMVPFISLRCHNDNCEQLHQVEKNRGFKYTIYCKKLLRIPQQARHWYKELESQCTVDGLSDRITVYALMEEYDLSKNVCGQKVTYYHIDEITKCHLKRWKDLGPHLKLEPIVADDIISDSKDCARQQRRCFLQKWVEKHGGSATYRELITALLNIDERNDAEYICKLLQDSSTAVEVLSIQKTSKSTTLTHSRVLKYLSKLSKPEIVTVGCVLGLYYIQYMDKMDEESLCSEIVDRWLKGEGLNKASWEKLVEILETRNHKNLALIIRSEEMDQVEDQVEADQVENNQETKNDN